MLCAGTTATKWGILSASKISYDFVLALETLSAEDHKVVAVAAKDISRAKDFAGDHGIPTYYGSYDELGNDPNVGRVIWVKCRHNFRIGFREGARGPSQNLIHVDTHEIRTLFNIMSFTIKIVYLLWALWHPQPWIRPCIMSYIDCSHVYRIPPSSKCTEYKIYIKLFKPIKPLKIVLKFYYYYC